MFKPSKFWPSFRSTSNKQAQFAAVVLTLLCGTIAARAQNTFSSGSTGADGALAPTSDQTVQVPASGVFNYTTVNIPSGVTVKFTPNARNTAVTILASGNVTVAGTINVDGQTGLASGFGGPGGPGGFRGGSGGLNSDSFAGTNGDGPGGGGGGAASANNANDYYGGGGGGHQVAGRTAESSAPNVLNGAGGASYGTTALLPLVGGSGGGGGAGSATLKGSAGGGGGGAILIASSRTITLNGTISARGGGGVSVYTPSGGGGGAGGAIRIDCQYARRHRQL